MNSADTEEGAIARSSIPHVSRSRAGHAFFTRFVTVATATFRMASIGYCSFLFLMTASPEGSRAWSSETSSEIIPAHPAIGRLNHAGFKSRAHCTSFAIRDSTLITAAHCLPKIQGDAVHVLLGYAQGSLQHHFETTASAYRTLPERDIAALCEIPAPSGKMTLTPDTPSPGTKVTVRGYGAPKVHVLQKTSCSVQTVSNNGFVMLDCALPPGASGAPVTIAETSDIIGLVSASAPARTLVSRLTPDILERLCEW